LDVKPKEEIYSIKITPFTSNTKVTVDTFSVESRQKCSDEICFHLESNSLKFTFGGSYQKQKYERKSTLIVTDKVSRLSTEAKLSFIFLANIYAPVFNTHTPTYIKPTMKVGDKIITVKATDRDDSPYNSIKYSIIYKSKGPNLADVASINEKTGEVTLVSIPRGYRNVSLLIQAADNGPGQPKSVTTTLLLKFDSDLELKCKETSTSRGFEADILESQPIGHPVCDIQLSDKRGLGYKHELHLQSNEYFEMSNGVIKLKKALDAEEEVKHTVEIEVLTKHTLKQRWTTYKLTVNVIDVNEFSPKFSILKSERTKTIVENTASDYFVFNAGATDGDVSANITYHMEGGGDHFKISEIGRISVDVGPDYEKKNSFTLVVVASDNQSKPKSTEITLNVKVTDRNEHKPMFTYPDSDRMTFYVQPGQEEPILTLKATDEDTGPISGVVYFSLRNVTQLDADVAKIFSVDKESGVVTLIEAPAEQHQDKEHAVHVQAYNDGSKNLRADRVLLVTIQLTKISYVYILTGVSVLLFLLLLVLAVVWFRKRPSRGDAEVSAYKDREVNDNGVMVTENRPRASENYGLEVFDAVDENEEAERERLTPPENSINEPHPEVNYQFAYPPSYERIDEDVPHFDKYQVPSNIIHRPVSCSVRMGTLQRPVSYSSQMVMMPQGGPYPGRANTLRRQDDRNYRNYLNYPPPRNGVRHPRSETLQLPAAREVPGSGVYTPRGLTIVNSPVNCYGNVQKMDEQLRETKAKHEAKYGKDATLVFQVQHPDGSHSTAC